MITHKITVEQLEYKNIKKGKQRAVLQLNNDTNKMIHKKDKILLINGRKKIKGQVKKVSKLEKFEPDYNKKLFGNSSYENLIKKFKKEDIEKYGLIIIEFQKKKHIVRNLLLGILGLIVLFMCYQFITYKLDEINTKKINKTINQMNQEKISYVFVEINPSLVMTIKNNEIRDIACLNDDCMNLYNNLDLKGKNLNESLETIYRVSKENGYDVSNGVKVRTTESLNIEKKNYITVEYIDSTKERELLNTVKNNQDIKNIDNQSYYSKLWEELKKDKDYDDIYTCSMDENQELECHIILETGIHNESDLDWDTYEEFSFLQNLLKKTAIRVLNTLKKFNFDVRDYNVYVNDIKFHYVPLFTDNGVPYRNVLSAEIIETFDPEICDMGILNYEDGKCQHMGGTYRIQLQKVNLMKPASIASNLEIHSNGIKDTIQRQYENQKMMEDLLEEIKEEEEHIKKCVSILDAKGFTCCDAAEADTNICGSCIDRDINTLKNSLFCIPGPYRECSMMNATFDKYCD